MGVLRVDGDLLRVGVLLFSRSKANSLAQLTRHPLVSLLYRSFYSVLSLGSTLVVSHKEDSGSHQAKKNPASATFVFLRFYLVLFHIFYQMQSEIEFRRFIGHREHLNKHQQWPVGAARNTAARRCSCNESACDDATSTRNSGARTTPLASGADTILDSRCSDVSPAFSSAQSRLIISSPRSRIMNKSL